MSEIAELERRIGHALDRISVAAGQDGSAAADEVVALRAELDEERTANAQLKERVRVLKQKQGSSLRSLEEQIEELRSQAARREGDLNCLRDANARLRSINTALREANAEGLADTALIDGAMAAEIEALRGVQKADRSELETVLDTLRPIVEESA